MSDGKTPIGVLSDLIETRFSAVDQIRIFVEDHFGFEAHIDWNKNRAVVANAVSAYLIAGNQTDGFLDRLCDDDDEEGNADPERLAEVEAVRAFLRAHPHAEGPADPDPDADPDAHDEAGGDAPIRLVAPTPEDASAYRDFEIGFVETVGGQANSYQVSASGVDELAPAVVINPGPPPTAELSDPARDAGGGPNSVPDHAEEYGQRIYNLLFSDAGGAGLDFPKIDRSGGTRLILDLADKPDLRKIPWELLRDERGRDRGLDVKSPIVRRIDIGDFVPEDLALTEDRPLRLLIVSAQPEGRSPLDIGAEIARILAVPNLHVLGPVPDTTHEILYNALQKHKPEILHFIGHGSGRGIELASDDSDSELLSASKLSNLVGNHLKYLRLVFLNSCRGAEESETERGSFANAAVDMIKAGLPASVAMQFAISDDAAVKLSEKFYRSLASGEEVDVALARARSFLSGEGRTEWAAPVLYAAPWEGRLALVNPAPSPPAASAGSSAPPSQPAVVRPSTAARPSAAQPRTAQPRMLPHQDLTRSITKSLVGGSRRGAAILVGAMVAIVGAFVTFGLATSDPDESATADGLETPDTADQVDDGDTSGADDQTTPSSSQAPVTTTDVSGPTVTQPAPTTTTTSTGSQDGPVIGPDQMSSERPVSVTDAGIQVINGHPGGEVDIYVDGRVIAPGTSAGSAVGPLTLDPGDHDLVIYPAQDQPPADEAARTDQPLLRETITVPPGVASIGLSPDGAEGLKATRFPERLTPVPAGQGRVVVRNLTASTTLGVMIDGDDLGSLRPGQELAIERDSGRVAVDVSDSDGRTILTSVVPIGEAELATLSISDVAEASAGRLTVQRHTGLPVLPELVPTGNSGLAALGRPWSTVAGDQIGQTRTTGTGGQGDAAAIGRTLGRGLVDAHLSRPVAVRVGGIDLSAPVIPVGTDEQNRLDVPAADLVGWYQYGASPGRPGSTVLAAHVDYDGSPGAFFNLSAVNAGEAIEVEMADGRVERYVVIHNTLHDKAELPIAELFRTTGRSVLQLVTCGGSFDSDQRSYRSNVVVTAVSVSSPVSGRSPAEVDERLFRNR